MPLLIHWQIVLPVSSTFRQTLPESRDHVLQPLLPGSCFRHICARFMVFERRGKWFAPIVLIFGKRIPILSLLSWKKNEWLFKNMWLQRLLLEIVSMEKCIILFKPLQNSMKWILLIFHVTNKTPGLSYPLSY